MSETNAILGILKDWWPIINSICIALIAVLSFGWRQVGRRIDQLTNAVNELTRSHNTTATTIAVVQSNLQQHTDQDRESFHEIRNDMGKRLDAQRLTVETLTSALLRAGVKA